MHDTNEHCKQLGRPRKRRKCQKYHDDRVYKPQGIPMREIETIDINLDEFEAMRLCDHDGLEQIEAGEKMGVSRGTVQRLLYKGRKKIIDALLHQHAFVINLNGNEEQDDTMHSHPGRQRSRRHHK